MAGAKGSAELEAWLGQLYAPNKVPDDDLNAPTLEWLRRHFDAHGPVSTESAWDAMLAHQVALAEAAVSPTDCFAVLGWLVGARQDA